MIIIHVIFQSHDAVESFLALITFVLSFALMDVFCEWKHKDC